MQFAQFPTEILSRLSEQLIFTDLILLHACGNRALNKKLSTAPLQAHVMSARCSTYYDLRLTARFGNIVDILDTFTRLSHYVSYIPTTVRKVVAKSRIGCIIPSSVDELTAIYVGPGSKFERNPLELSVTVFMVLYSEDDIPKYITTTKGLTSYDPLLTNLKKMYLPSWCKITPIPGVELVYSTKCRHMSTNSCITDENNVWFSTKCTACGAHLEVHSKNGTSCLPLPPCKSVIIHQEHYGSLAMILAALSRGTDNIRIDITLKNANEFCSSNGLDLIPSSVDTVMINIKIGEGEAVKPVTFVGLKKVYPFVVCVRSYDSQFVGGITIENYTGIDEVYSEIYNTTADRKNATQSNPRLSIIDW